MKNGNISDNNSGNNVCSNEKLSTPFLSEADIISDIHDFYQVGIENYCAKIDTNVVLLDELKEKYLEIIFDMIKLNLGIINMLLEYHFLVKKWIRSDSSHIWFILK